MLIESVLFILTFIIALGVFLWAASAIVSISFGSPPVATPLDEVYWALKMAEPKKGETLIDLGCGDGRVLVVGANYFQLKGVGYELAPWGNLITRLKIWDDDLDGQVKIITKSLYKAKLGEADIIYIYLFPEAIKKISGRIIKYAKPGTRIISVAFPIPGWKADKTQCTRRNPDIKVYLYTIKNS